VQKNNGKNSDEKDKVYAVVLLAKERLRWNTI